jgi:hypothetical protein
MFCRGAVPPVVGIAREGQRDSEKIMDYSGRVLDYLSGEASIKSVILAAQWSLYTKGWNENPEEGLPGFAGHPFATLQAMEDYYRDQIRFTVKRLLDAGKQVAIVYPVLEVGFDIPDYLSKRSAAGLPMPSAVPCPDFKERQAAVIAALDSIGDHPNLSRVRPHDRLMDKDDVKILLGREPLYFDDDHLSTPGAFYLKALFEPVFPKL